MLKIGFIEPMEMEWAAPIVFAAKKNRSLHFCVDYSKLHPVTVFDNYPMLRTDESVDWLGSTLILSTLDDNWSYWQLYIDEADRDKTAFTLGHAMYRLAKVRFRICNAPGTFQQDMYVILSLVQWQFVLEYFDDIVIISRNADENILRVHPVLSLLHKQSWRHIKP